MFKRITILFLLLSYTVTAQVDTTRVKSDTAYFNHDYIVIHRDTLSKRDNQIKLYKRHINNINKAKGNTLDGLSLGTLLTVVVAITYSIARILK